MISPALLDRLIADLSELREAVAGTGDREHPAEPFDEEDLIDTATASERFLLAPDTIRWFAREKGMGIRQGGRWLLSARLLREHLKR